MIEEITEDNTVTSGESNKPINETQRESNNGGGLKTDLDGLQALKDDPEAIRFNTVSKLLYRYVFVHLFCLLIVHSFWPSERSRTSFQKLIPTHSLL